jgi:hypothetical protein
MTEAKARDMPESEPQPGSNAQPLAHSRPVVERCLLWSGLVPLPAFLVIHVARELRSSFATDISAVARATPGTLSELCSLLGVWLPLGVHVGAAAVLWLRGQLPRKLEADVAPAARSISRVCAVLGLAFLLYHAQTLVVPVWLGQAAPEDAGFRLLEELSSTSSGVPLNGGLYLLGLLAIATHTALGVHRGLLVEGVLDRPDRRRLSARACAAGGAALFCAAAASVIRVASGALLR